MQTNTEDIEQIANEVLLTTEILSEVINENLWYTNPITLRKLIVGALTSLSQHHQDKLREVYREILAKEYIAFGDGYEDDVVAVDDIKALAQTRGIDISDKTDAK